MLKLGGGYSLAIENDLEKARLIVYKDGVENVCRKENFKKLKQFILSDQNRLFKGRLQLHKNMDGIMVEVKGQSAGIIKVDAFIGYLENIR